MLGIHMSHLYMFQIHAMTKKYTIAEFEDGVAVVSIDTFGQMRRSSEANREQLEDL